MYDNFFARRAGEGYAALAHPVRAGRVPWQAVEGSRSSPGKKEQDFDELSPNGERGAPYAQAGTAAFIASFNQAQARLSARVIVSPRNCASSSR